MTKKLRRFVFIIPILAVFLVPFFFSASTFARPVEGTTASGTESGESSGSSGSGGSSTFTGHCDSSFLGLTSWDCNVDISDQNSLVNGVTTIAMNILTDISIIAAYLVLGYVIYGGYLYTFSGGDPGKIANGKKTLTQAFIGLAIVMLANVILNTIRIALGANFSDNCATAQCVNPGEMVTNAIQWVIGVAGIVSIIFVVYGGISYTTSAGDPGKLKKAKDMILYSLIGLTVVALAEMITAFVTNIIKNA